MKAFNVLSFLVKSIMMGMIAALFLFQFFPELLDKEAVEEPAPAKLTEIYSFKDAIAKASSSVVNIRTLRPVTDSNNNPSLRVGIGSGVIISEKGYIVTNYHVIYGAQEIAVELTDGRSAIAEVIGQDADTDLAVLRVDILDLPAILLDDKIPVEVGDLALAIGNPFGVGQAVTMGIVSATGRKFLGLSEYEDFIQTDVAINPGNSGGALINSRGDLIGISSAYFTQGARSGISFVIPTAMVMDVIEQIIAHGRVVRGWLGFSGGPLNPQGKLLFNQEADKGFIVTRITPEGPADKAGLMVNDVIMKINNKPLNSDTDLLNNIAEARPGTEVILEVIREEQSLTLTAIVEERPQPVSAS